jgi:hypothetical protein
VSRESALFGAIRALRNPTICGNRRNALLGGSWTEHRFQTLRDDYVIDENPVRAVDVFANVSTPGIRMLPLRVLDAQMSQNIQKKMERVTAQI